MRCHFTSKSKSSLGVVLLFGLLFYSCQPDIVLPKKPEMVVQQWQFWVNANAFDKAALLSTSNTIEWLEWVKEVVDSSEKNSSFHFLEIDCILEAQRGICPCVIRDMNEVYPDTFFIKKQSEQWLVDIPSSQLEPSSTLDDLLE